MGNQQFHGKNAPEAVKHGGVFIKFENPVVYGDKVINATIYLDVKRDYPIKQLVFKLKGKERINWIENVHKIRKNHEDKKEEWDEDEHRVQEYIIMNHTQVIHEWDSNEAHKSQYVFPVQFKFPKNIPGSFFVKKDRVCCEILYKLEAIVIPSDPKLPKLKHKAKIPYRELDLNTQRTEPITINHDLKSCCCSGGSVIVIPQLNNQTYLPGEKIQIYASIDNTLGKAKIKKLPFTLNQVVQCQCINTITDKTFKRILRYKLGEGFIEGCKAGEDCRDDKSKKGEFKLPEAQIGDIRREEKMDAEFTKIDEKLLNTIPTVNGYLVQSHLTMSLTVEQGGCMCCGKTPVVEIPVRVLPYLPNDMETPKEPTQWYPQSMDPRHFLLEAKKGIQDRVTLHPQMKEGALKVEVVVDDPPKEEEEKKGDENAKNNTGGEEKKEDEEGKMQKSDSQHASKLEDAQRIEIQNKNGSQEELPKSDQEKPDQNNE